MAVEQAKNLEVFNAVWDSWMKGMDLVKASNEKFEKLTLQALEQQQAFMKKSLESYFKAEEELQHFLQEFKQQQSENIRQSFGNQVSESFEKWNEKWIEILDKLRKTTTTPSKQSLDLLSQAQEQIYTAYKQIIEQQKESRQELNNLIENFLQQCKAVQKSLVEASNSPFPKFFFKN
jgi:polyhydroxyalkanoic acid inclusion protein PhaP